MIEPQWILPEVVIAIHQMVLAEHGGLPGIRDTALLESALMRPQQRYFYEDATSLFDLAASYSYGIAQNHPFMDGNKRVALTVAATFLELNGYALKAPEAEVVVIFRQLAAGNLTEASLARWFQASTIALE